MKNYVNMKTSFQGLTRRQAEAKAEEMFQAARRSVIAFLQDRKARLYFLFDSMDTYPVRQAVFLRGLTGLFQALSSINSESKYIVISFSIPEEIEGFLTGTSATPLKDFSSSYRIKWRPIDLLRIVAHRFRLAMSIFDEGFYDEIEDLDFSRRRDIHELFSRILPNPMTNALGDPEDPLAYIIRHTQLLPRHVIAIFNAILSGNYNVTGGFRRVDASAIRDGVAHVQQIIANQIRYPYNNLYPGLFEACHDILPDLNPICSYGALKSVESRFNKRIETDVSSVRQILFHIGVLGRVVKPVNLEDLPDKQSDRYCYGDFHFNINGAFGMSTNREYCFHPVFSRAFGIDRPEEDHRVVYPANVEMVTMT